jgi:glyoxylase-like metal-dependent hydrolase (beta-lactamase superfamily II)
MTPGGITPLRFDFVHGSRTITLHPTAVETRFGLLLLDGRSMPRNGGNRDRSPPVPVDVQLTGGETIRTDAGPMRVVELPGHCPGYVSLYFPDHGFLVAEDALVSEEGLSGAKPEFKPEFETATESVARLAALEVAHVR